MPFPVTVVEAGPCRVAQVKTPGHRRLYGHPAGFRRRGKRTNKPTWPATSRRRASNQRAISSSFGWTSLGEFSSGDEIKADVFENGEMVDVIGVTKGKGFAGRYEASQLQRPLGASHGTQKKHRSPGSIGACATPARVFKGTRMAGHMGHTRVTTLNLQVIKADPERNLLLIRGAVPGPKGGLVMVRRAVRLRQRSSGRKAS